MSPLCTPMRRSIYTYIYTYIHTYIHTYVLFTHAHAQVVFKEVPVPVDKIVYREVPVPVEVPVQSFYETTQIKEIPVDRVITNEVSIVLIFLGFSMKRLRLGNAQSMSWVITNKVRVVEFFWLFC